MGERSGCSEFYVMDGSVLSSIEDLSDAFDRMSDDTYYHHVTESRNDFASWISDAVGSQSLSDEIKRANSRAETHVAVLKHLLSEARRK